MQRHCNGRAVFLLAIFAAANRAAALITFNINQTAGRAAISPLIYGVNTDNIGGVANPGLNQSAYQNLNLTFERLGGDRWTAYNYTNNASNAGSDYIYENDNYLGGGSTPAGAVLPFLQGASGGGAIVTVPMAGYVAADESGPVPTPLAAPAASSHFVLEYPTVAADPAPAANHVYENQFVQLVKNAFPGTASRPLVFDLDNEPDLWDSSHPEVHPSQTTYAELLSDSISYATMIKSIAPSALVYGPVSYGWDGYTTLQGAPDSAANGDFLTYYLKNMATASSTAGVRLLDGLDLHWYPEATGKNASGDATRITGTDTSPGVVAARLQAPRSLWDPTYSETSYITQDEGYTYINLINREEGKINSYYPGTKLSFGEYNYGAGGDISGGLAEADVLGIFGKYGVYSANEWPLLGSEPFIAGAFRMFRNYDGNNSTFGDTEVQAVNSDTVNSSVYASVDSTNPDHLTLIVINKQNAVVPTAINISNGGMYKTAAIYQLTSGSSTPQSAGTMTLNNPTAFNYNMPAYSVSVISLLSNQWLLSTGGSWASAASWSAGMPDGKAAEANFLSSPSGITSPGTVTLDGNHTVGQLTFNNSNSYTIAQGSGGVLSIDDTGDTSGVNPLISVQAGNHILAAPLSLANGVAINTANGSTLTISSSINGSGGVTVSGGGSVILSHPGSGIMVRSFGSLNITGQLQIAPVLLPANRTLLVAGSLAITGKLDLANNDLDVPGGNLTTIFNLVSQGYQKPGRSIFSSSAAGDTTHLTTLGTIQNSVDGTTTGLPLYASGTVNGLFDTTSPAAGDVLVKYTYFGDANLDGKVDGSDYSRIDNGYLHALTGWYNGDFNYDGYVNGSDYTLIDNTFNRQGTTESANVLDPHALVTAQVAVPEPAMNAILLTTVVGMLSRRRPVRGPRVRGSSAGY